jgi:hypothetical protein
VLLYTYTETQGAHMYQVVINLAIVGMPIIVMLVALIIKGEF